MSDIAVAKKNKKKVSSEDKKKKPEKKPWYADGLRFECTQCGDCCSGDPGFVWVADNEIESLAAEMEMTVDEFEHQFVRELARGKSLKEYPDGDCILLDPDTRKCTVYAARPIQCRTWPFWDSNLKKRKDWKETCQVCPGAGKGKLYTLDHIERTRKQKSV